MTDYLSINMLASLTLLLAIAALLLFLYAKRTRTQMRASIKLINELYQVSQSQQNQIKALEANKHTQATLAPENDAKEAVFEKMHERLAQLEHKYTVLENQTQLLQSEDPELKMYNKASELVKAGASIDDVLEASQLPRAEVEVLMSLHKKRKSPNTK